MKKLTVLIIYLFLMYTPSSYAAGKYIFVGASNGNIYTINKEQKTVKKVNTSGNERVADLYYFEEEKKIFYCSFRHYVFCGVLDLVTFNFTNFSNESLGFGKYILFNGKSRNKNEILVRFSDKEEWEMESYTREQYLNALNHAKYDIKTGVWKSCSKEYFDENILLPSNPTYPKYIPLGQIDKKEMIKSALVKYAEAKNSVAQIDETKDKFAKVKQNLYSRKVNNGLELVDIENQEVYFLEANKNENIMIVTVLNE